jgi:hypothetical protein
MAKPFHVSPLLHAGFGQWLLALPGLQEPLVITRNGGDLGGDFVISATPTKARKFDC